MNQEVQKISQEEVRAAMKWMKKRKSVGLDDIPVEIWRRENSGLVNHSV